jgi:hypothetical protein
MISLNTKLNIGKLTGGFWALLFVVFFFVFVASAAIFYKILHSAIIAGLSGVAVFCFIFLGLIGLFTLSGKGK